MRALSTLLLVALMLTMPASGRAQAWQPGFFELQAFMPALYDFLWKAPTDPTGAVITPVLPPECRLRSRERKLSADGEIELGRLQCPDGLADKTLRFEGLVASETEVIVRVNSRDGETETYRLGPVSPQIRFPPEPTAWEALRRQAEAGLMQPLGTDHLLFLLGLMLVGGGPGRGGPTVIALLVGHSLTLWGTTLGYLHLALPPLEVVVALSVLFLGPEIVRRWHGQHDVTQHFPWIVSLLLGMLHGAGFASGYDGPAAAPADIPAGLLLFIAGVELTLLPAILLAVLLARGCRRLQRSGSWLIAVMPGYAVGSLGAYLTVKRALQLLAPMI